MKNEQQHGKNRNTRKETNNTKINKERKKEKTHYADNGSRKGANCVQAEN
jgi:hypothetical protein